MSGLTRTELRIFVARRHDEAIRNARLPFRDFCFARIDSEGNERHIAISGEPMFAGGRFIGYRGVGSDVTDRRRAEERQDAHARHQEIIAEFGRNALRLHDPQALQNYVY